MRKHSLSTLLIWIALCWPAGVQATTLIVLDNSGSMAEMTAGGRTKAAEALQVLRDTFIPGLPARSQAALWSFGGGCRSLQFRGRLGEPAQVRADLARIRPPSGGTPLAWSIRHALVEIKRWDEPRHVIVVTDGNDTCGFDPCDEVRQAGAEGAKITVHTVGLGMSRRDGAFRVLQCMADASHDGTAQVVEPGDGAGRLDDVLDRLAKGLEEPKGELLVEVIDPRGRSRRGIGYVARSAATGVEHRGTSGTPLALPPGHYRVDGGHEISGSVDVRAAAVSRLRAASDLGHVVLSGVCQEGLGYAIIDDAGTTVQTLAGADHVEIVLPPGDYAIVLSRYPQLPPQEFVVRASQENSVSVGQFGTLLVNGRDAVGRELDLPLEIFDDRQPAEAPPVATGQTQREFLLPVGIYNVRVSPDDPRAPGFTRGDNVQIRRCKTESVELRQRAVLRVCGAGGTVRIWNDGDGSSTSGGVGQAIPLAPGVYNLELPGGRFIANYVIEEGVHEIGCP